MAEWKSMPDGHVVNLDNVTWISKRGKNCAIHFIGSADNAILVKDVNPNEILAGLKVSKARNPTRKKSN